MPLDHDAIRVCYDQLLAEKNLVPDAATPIGDIAVSQTIAAEAPPVRLIGISGTQHVNRLLDDQELEFNPRLTVIYGENASGKTGYVRVLKAVAGARSAEPVLPDVYRTVSATPAARIEYALGQENERLEWSEGITAPATLRRISVFDAPAAPLHVDDDLSYSYTPAGIALFEIAHSAIAEIKDRLMADLNDRRPKGNPFLSRFQRGTRVYQLIETLRATTDIEDLRALAVVGEAEVNRISQLRTQIRTLDGNNHNLQLQAARSAKKQCAAGREVIDVLLSFDGSAYKEAVDEVATCRARVKAVTEELFAADAIPGLFTDEWKAFINAADAYMSRHFHDRSEVPDTCPYCAQGLADDARKLVGRYKTYLTDQAQFALVAATQTLSDARRPIEDLAPIQTPNNGERSSDASELPWVAGVRRASEMLEQQQRRLAADLPWDLPDAVVSELQTSRATLEDQWETSDGFVQDLSTETKERETRLASAKAELSDLEDRLTLGQLLAAIEEHVQVARWTDLANSVIGRFQGLLKSLTDATKAATSEILNSNFETAFQQECVLLACPLVRLEFPGRQGASLRHKSVGTDHRLGKVLSEGEQKVIALADFLAEVSLRPSSAPIVFDDPITSLDSRRADEVAERLVALSAYHQVIVFTHHLYFASKLLADFEPTDLRDQCSFYEVLAEDGSVGLVQRGTHPRTDTVKSIKGRVNKTLQEARAASGSARDDHIATAYGHIRAWIETFVEDELLQGSVKRHRASISVDALARVDGTALDSAIGALKPVYDRACRRIWPHAHTHEQLQSRPTIDDVESDWDVLNSIADQLKSR